MGSPVRGVVSRLFQGVSRQPDPIRLEGQVEEAVNVWMSILSGGFEPRPGSELFFTLQEQPTTSVFTYAYRRDDDESYLMLAFDGTLRVFNSSGAEVFSLTDPYLVTNDPAQDLRAVTAGDVTLIVNRTVATQYRPTTAGSGPDVAAITCVNGDNVHGHWVVELEVGGQTYMATTSDIASTSGVISSLAGKLRNEVPSDVANVTYKGSTMIIENLTPSAMSVTTQDFFGDRALELSYKRVDSTDLLPPMSVHGHKVAVGTEPDTQIWNEFVRDDGNEVDRVPGKGYWKEAVAPGSRYELYSTTMPLAVKNTAPDTFEKYDVEWKNRKWGFEGDIFEPLFIGKPIQDITFHRDRLILVSGENIDCSKQGDYFQFFPEKSTEVLDTDAFSRTASSRRVNYLYHAIPFRSQLFLMSENGQFELRGDPALTPKTATLELATQYQAESGCAPAVMGSELYFAATVDQNSSAVYEYYFSEAAVSNTANNATIQVEGYVPGPAKRIVTDTITNTLFLLQERNPNRLYVYKTFWDGMEKRQSCWSYWEFRFDILNIDIFLDRLVLVTQTGDQLSVFQVPLSNRSPLLRGLDTQFHLDSLIEAADIIGDETTGVSQLTFSHPLSREGEAYCLAFLEDGLDIRRAVVSEGGSTATVNTLYPEGTKVYVGYSFESFVELSTLMPRDDNNRLITDGRTQLRRLGIDYENSTKFNVTWERSGRNPKSSPFVAGESRGEFSPLASRKDSGTHMVKLRGDSSDTTIRIGSDQPYTYKIIGVRWEGTYYDKYRR